MIIDGRGEKCLRDPVTLFHSGYFARGHEDSISIYVHVFAMPKNKMPEQFSLGTFHGLPFSLEQFSLLFSSWMFFFSFFLPPREHFFFLGQGFEQVAVFGNLRLHE